MHPSPFSASAKQATETLTDILTSVCECGTETDTIASVTMSGNNNDGDNDDNNDDDSFNSDELDFMLENMDIDKDFNTWSSFRSSISHVKVSVGGTSGTKSKSAPPSKEEKVETQDIQKWRNVHDRPEVYSHRYRPDPQEVQELGALETLLGMKKRTGLFRSVSTGDTNKSHGKHVSQNDLAIWNRLVHSGTSTSTGTGSACLPASIILKRGPALMEKEGEADDDQEEEECECELILLTHGLIVATVTTPAAPRSSRSVGKGRNQKLVPRSFERAVLWRDVATVSPISSQAWEIHLKSSAAQEHPKRLILVCATAKQRQAWLDAMERVIVEYHLHRTKPPTEFGWQYRYIVKPAFTMAVTDQTDLDMRAGDDLNQLDAYHGYAALHYAVRANHAAAMRRLLDEGADPDVPDQDGRTPMYYAVMDQLDHTTVSLLESYGATASKMAETQQNGKLFGRVAAAQSNVDEQRRETAERKKAEVAAAAMSQNMRLLQRRGEQIDELDDKAQQLNDNAKNFGNMAKQLKEQHKKKKWYQL
jgi:hypothetical protein